MGEQVKSLPNGKHRRPLTTEDMRRMNMGRRFWEVSLSVIPDALPYKKEIANYLCRIDQMIGNGWGLFLWGPNATGKCVVPGTWVYCNGRLKRIGSLYTGNLVYAPVVGTTGSLGDYGENIKCFYDDGIQQTLRVVLKNGLELVGTPDHPILIRLKNGNEEFVKLKDIVTGMMAVVDTSAKIEEGKPVSILWGKQNLEITEDFAELYGWVLAEGHIEWESGKAGGNVNVTNTDNNVIRRVKYLFESIFGVEANICKYSGKPPYVAVSNIDIAQLFSRLGCMGVSRRKWVAEELMSSPQNVIIKFLRAFFDGEGYVNSRGNWIEISQASVEIIDSVQIMLLGLGIYSTVGLKLVGPKNFKNKTARRYSKLSIGGSDVIRFRDIIGFDLPEKRKNLDCVDSYTNNSKRIGLLLRYNSIPYISPLVGQIKYEVRKHLGILNTGSTSKSWTKIMRGVGSIGYSLVNSMMWGRYTDSAASRYALNEFYDCVKGFDEQCPSIKILKKLLDKDCRYTEVALVENYGLHRVVDLVVEPNHAFWSNGMVSHNTAAACLIALEAKRRGYRVLFIEASEYADAIIRRKPFDDLETIEERCKSVDLLILDDLGKEGRTSTFFIETELEELIRARSNERKATIITSNMNRADSLEVYKESMLNVMQATVHPVKVYGMDFRLTEKQQLDVSLVGEANGA